MARAQVVARAHGLRRWRLKLDSFSPQSGQHAGKKRVPMRADTAR